jgi:APA family basic amino acid/polyamine antiporter
VQRELLDDARRTKAARTPLRRLIGGTTALAIGLGVAIGSGIFRTPGGIARELDSPGWIIVAWMCGGLFTLAAGLVTAELATRFPEAGGEYVFLREAYGEFAAFFFGWSYTVFVIAGGAAVIAVPIGEVSASLFGLGPAAAPWISAAALALVTTLNCAGLRIGADAQNVLSFAKTLALIGLAVVAFARGGAASGEPQATTLAVGAPAGVLAFLLVFAGAFRQVLWCYDGTTDSVKMAEEIRDVKRALPRALIASSLLLTFVYVLVNASFLYVLSPREMASSDFVAKDVMRRLIGPSAEKLMALLIMLVCLGSMASTTLATVRVTFALARDGLAPRLLAGMSAAQSPVAALIVVGLMAVAFVLSGGFQEVLAVYSFAAAILFSLNYASLLVFRRRGRCHSADIFRCPAGPALVVALILVQAGIAFAAARTYPAHAIASAGLLVGIALLYVIWKALTRSSPAPTVRP